MLQKPKMILFDYGQILADEKGFDGLAGSRAILAHAVENKRNVTAEELQAEAIALNREVGRTDPLGGNPILVEVPNRMFSAYLYESMGIKLSLTPPEIDHVFWDGAAPAVPTQGIGEFLDFLRESGIRTGVVSNISFSGEALTERIHRLFPGHRFEFILASSEYVFRKPSRRIFDLALEKAELSPSDVWYVGDNFVCDVEGAGSAGLFPVYYTGAAKKTHPAEGILTVASWDELQCILDTL